MSDIVRKQFQRVERTVDGVKRVLFVASTDSVDRYGDIVDQGTWKLDNYRANPVVQLDHIYSAEYTIARGEVATDGGALTLEIVAWSAKARAQDVRQDVEDGIVNAVSVGFRPGRAIPRSQLPAEDPRAGTGGYVYYDCELLEVSVVAIPANADALIAAKSIGPVSARDLAAALLARPEFLTELRAQLTLSGADASEPSDLFEFPDSKESTPELGFFT